MRALFHQTETQRMSGPENKTTRTYCNVHWWIGERVLEVDPVANEVGTENGTKDDAYDWERMVAFEER